MDAAGKVDARISASGRKGAGAGAAARLRSSCFESAKQIADPAVWMSARAGWVWMIAMVVVWRAGEQRDEKENK